MCEKTHRYRIVHAGNNLNAVTASSQALILREDADIIELVNSIIFLSVDVRDELLPILMLEQIIPYTEVGNLSGIL